MKIAIPSKSVDGMTVVDSHFGHCEFYTVVTVDDDKKEVVVEENVAASKGCGCKSDIAPRLYEEGVRVLLAGNMGQGAVDRLDSVGIEAIRGYEGQVRSVVEKYLAGEIPDQGEICAHDHDHDEDGGCHHHEIPTMKSL